MLAVRGVVHVSEDLRTKGSALSALRLWVEGEVLTLGEDSRVDLLEGGTWTTYLGPGELRRHRGKTVRTGKIEATVRRALEPPLWQEDSEPILAWRPGSARAPNRLRIETPRETATTDVRPTLRWRRANPRLKTRLDLLMVVDGQLEPVERWRGLPGVELRVHHPLRESTLYLWRIQEERPGGEREIEQAWFWVHASGGADSMESWIDALPELRSEDSADRGAAEALLALGHERIGLLEEATKTWRALASQPGGDAALQRSRELETRQLVSPRERMLFPLPFGLRLNEL